VKNSETLTRQAKLLAQSQHGQQKTFGKDTLAKIPGGHTQGNELHHLAIIDLYEPFFTNLNKQDQFVMADTLHSMGVRVANDPLNLISIPMKVHRGESSKKDPGGIHAQALKDGIQINNSSDIARGTFVTASGKTTKPVNDLLNRIRNAPLEDRLAILPDFVDINQGGLDEKLRNMGLSFPTREENIQTYNREIEAEHIQVQLDHINRVVNKEADLAGAPKSGEKRAGVKIDSALRGGYISLEELEAINPSFLEAYTKLRASL